VQACLFYEDLYDLRVVADRRELFARTFHSLAAACSSLPPSIFCFRSWRRPGRRHGRRAPGDGDHPGWRMAFESVVRCAAPRERLIIVGTVRLP
jgi:hypothetical protein